ncbi:hypothetical protein [Fluviibacterium sp. S390]|uniref:hypothetical protein n=1 Tax=Fluviibacterium sp. S390 TaxID=3415139 RepID=UPI003C7E8F4F
MAKLADLKKWMTQTLRGDDARARSLVQVGRKGGAFATGGRGKGSPEMKSSDATNALILSLYDGPPTKCVAVIEEVASLTPFSVEVAPNGPREGGILILYGSDIDEQAFPRPACFEVWPENAWTAIAAVLCAEDRPYHLDCISYSLSDWGPEISLTIHDLTKDVETDLESETDFFQFTVSYRPPGFTPGAQTGGKHTTHSLSGDQIARLYCLIRGIDPEAD